MRVLVYTSLFPSPAWSTQWVYHRNAVIALAEFCDVRVVAPIPWAKYLAHRAALTGARAYTLAGVPVSHPIVWNVPGLHGLHAAAMHRSTRGVLRDLHREWAFDVILGIWAYPDAYAAVLHGRDFGCPTV